VYRYEQIEQANFNFVIGGNGVGNDAGNTQALKAASTSGLRFLLTDSRLRRTISDSVYDASRASTLEDQTSSLMHYLLEQEGSGRGSRAASGPGKETAP